jgi:hypothetical protein
MRLWVKVTFWPHAQLPFYIAKLPLIKTQRMSVCPLLWTARCEDSRISECVYVWVRECVCVFRSVRCTSSGTYSKTELGPTHGWVRAWSLTPSKRPNGYVLYFHPTTETETVFFALCSFEQNARVDQVQGTCPFNNTPPPHMFRLSLVS